MATVKFRKLRQGGYDLAEAIKLVKATAIRNFTESVDVIIFSN